MKSSFPQRAGVLCVGVLCTLVPALAVDWKALKSQGPVSDFAGVVDQASKAELESYAARVKQATGAELAFVTLPSLQGEPIEDVANDLFHAWGIGRKGVDNGVLLLLSIGDRKSKLEVGFGLGGTITDGMSGPLLEDMRPALRQSQYGPALIAAAERLGSTIAQSKGVTVAPPAVQFHVPRSAPDSIPWPLILFGIFFLMLLLRGGGNRFGGGRGGGGGGGFWTGLLLGQILNAGRGGFGGGRDGGGFGGFDSGGGGGGFGGFGGGDSGGGGASSDW